MFWKKPKEDDREKQIKQLKNAFPSIRRPNNDDTVFEIRFVVQNQYNSLRIFTPIDFPQTRPVLQVIGPLIHPWLDQFKQVNGSPKLLNWGKNSLITEIVEECLTHLLHGSISPPAPMAQQQVPQQQQTFSQPPNSITPSNTTIQPQYYPPNQYTNQTNNVNPSSFNQQPNNSYQTQQPSQLQYNANSASMYYNSPAAIPSPSLQTYPSASPNSSVKQNTPQSALDNSASMSSAVQIQSNQSQASLALNLPPAPGKLVRNESESIRTPLSIPDVPTSFPELDKLTTLQLERFLADAIALEVHVNAHPSVESMVTLRDQLRQSNYDHASKNVLMDEQLQQLYKESTEAKEKLKDKSFQYQRTLENAKAKFFVDTSDIVKELSSKRDRLEEQSDEFGQKLITGEVEFSNFIQESINKRVEYHTLNEKLKIATKAQNKL